MAKTLQLKRNASGNPYKGRTAAIEGLTALLKENGADGEIMIARYYEDADNENDWDKGDEAVKTIVGILHLFKYPEGETNAEGDTFEKNVSIYEEDQLYYTSFADGTLSVEVGGIGNQTNVSTLRGRSVSEILDKILFPTVKAYLSLALGITFELTSPLTSGGVYEVNTNGHNGIDETSLADGSQVSSGSVYNTAPFSISYTPNIYKCQNNKYTVTGNVYKYKIAKTNTNNTNCDVTYSATIWYNKGADAKSSDGKVQVPGYSGEKSSNLTVHYVYAFVHNGYRNTTNPAVLYTDIDSKNFVSVSLSQDSENKTPLGSDTVANRFVTNSTEFYICYPNEDKCASAGCVPEIYVPSGKTISKIEILNTGNSKYDTVVYKPTNTNNFWELEKNNNTVVNYYYNGISYQRYKKKIGSLTQGPSLYKFTIS